MSSHYICGTCDARVRNEEDCRICRPEEWVAGELERHPEFQALRKLEAAARACLASSEGREPWELISEALPALDKIRGGGK